MSTPPVALTIAGSDSGGGAGIQADLKTFAALGVHGTSAITAITAQNTRVVQDVHVVPAYHVVLQVETVLDDLDVRATKTGMLATAEIIEAVALLAKAGSLPNLVVDPVMVAASGASLLEPEAERAYVEKLFPYARVITPNLLEAGALLGRPITGPQQQRDAARALADLGPETVVVKGGHGTGAEAIDAVWAGGEVSELRAPRVDTPNTHGTGCSFASAIAAGLALGDDVHSALTRAKAYVYDGLVRAAGWRLGSGHGPIAHFRWEAGNDPTQTA